MKKIITAFLVSGLLSVGFLPVGRASAAPYCGITWGSLPKVAADTNASESITNIRTGQHACYDRMVVDLNGSGAGYDVRYVTNVYAEGSGKLITLHGGAKLQITVMAPNYNVNTGAVTYPAQSGQPLPNVDPAGYQTFRDAKFAGSFEGQTTVGLGVRAQLPFRVLKLDNRVVIDVAHHW